MTGRNRAGLFELWIPAVVARLSSTASRYTVRPDHVATPAMAALCGQQTETKQKPGTSAQSRISVLRRDPVATPSLEGHCQSCPAWLPACLARRQSNQGKLVRRSLAPCKSFLSALRGLSQELQPEPKAAGAVSWCKSSLNSSVRTPAARQPLIPLR
jgi:hypothetical protein